VRGADAEAWRSALRPNTRLMYCESPSNPLMELVDLEAFAATGRAAGALTVVDNCLCTPALQQPLRFGVDLVIHSATKSIDGQGRVLVVPSSAGRALIRDAVLPVLRTAGPSLSPFNAWVLLKGLETLSLRMHAQSASALNSRASCKAHPAVARVHHPGLDSHGQHELAQRQQAAGGAVLSFELRGADAEVRQRAWRNDRCHAADVDHRQPRRHAQHDHPSRQHDTQPPQRRAAAGGRHRRRADPRRGRAGVGGRSAAGLAVALAAGGPAR